MAAYSLDLRERVLSDSERGLSTEELVEKYEVSTAWVNRLKQRYRESGKIEPQKIGRPQGSQTDQHAHRLKGLIEEQPDRTITELQELLGVDVSWSTIWRAVGKLGYRFKKNDSSFRKR